MPVYELSHLQQVRNYIAALTCLRPLLLPAMFNDISYIWICLTEYYSMEEQRYPPIASAAANSGTADARHYSTTSAENDSPAVSEGSLIVTFEPPDLPADAWVQAWTRWASWARSGNCRSGRQLKIPEFLVKRLHAGINSE